MKQLDFNSIYKNANIFLDRKYEMFHLQSSVECLERVMNNEKPYPHMDREDVF